MSLVNTEVTASAALNVSANAAINTTTLATFSPLGTTVANATASVDVGGTSVLTSTGNTDLNAGSQVTTTVKPGGIPSVPLPADAAVAIATINSTSTVKVGGSAQVNAGGAVNLTATNQVTAETVADATSGGSAAVGGTVAVTVLNSVTKASIEDTAQTSSTALNVSADSKNTVTSTAKAAAEGATKQTAAQSAANPSETEKTLKDYKEEGKTSSGSVDVAAAVAVSSVNSQTRALISSTGTQVSTGLVNVSSLATSSSAVEADGTTIGDSATVGVGAAVAINVGVLDNAALIASNTDVTGRGVTVKAGTHAGETNTLSTTSTSGAGASSVGVAGSLAVGTLVSNATAALQGGSTVNAGTGDVRIEAGNVTSSSVNAGAEVTGLGDSAKVGVGASVGVNVGVNTTLAEVANAAALSGGANMVVNAIAEHAMDTEVTGGAGGAQIAVTPVAAVSVGINSTTARLGTGNALNLSGSYASLAEQTTEQKTAAKGQTQGNQVAVGASLALGVAEDTVLASIERSMTAALDVDVKAASTSKSDTSATASVSGGKEADSSGDAAPGESVDQQVKGQGDSAKDSGKTTATKSGQTFANTKLDASKGKASPKAESGGKGVSVAAAVGVNAANNNVGASVANGVTINSAGGALNIGSTAETDAKAKADGSQVDAGGTNVGVGAAVAVNAATSTNKATLGDDARVATKGLSVKAQQAAGQVNDYGADAKSGAGAANVGVAGSLAVNAVVSTTTASVGTTGAGTGINAGAGDVDIVASSKSASTVKSGAEVENSGGSAKVGVGASVGVNVGVNTTLAEVANAAVLNGGRNMTLNASGNHKMDTAVTGGAGGAQIAVTPVAAVSVGINSTTARLGTGSALNLSGSYASLAEQTTEQKTVATGQTQGDKVAVGASLALGVAEDTVQASIERNITAALNVDVKAASTSKSDTSATASVSGGKKADSSGNAASGESVDDQVEGQGNSAKDSGKKTAVASGQNDADTKLTASKGKAAPKAETSQGGVSVAAAIGVNVAGNTVGASVARGVTINSGGGALNVGSTAETDAKAKADGSQVDSGGTNVGVGAAVALNVATSSNTATVGDDAQVTTKGLSVKAEQAAGQTNDYGAESKSGAGAANVGVAGSLALNVVTSNTKASLETDTNASGKGANVNAGTGNVDIVASSASQSTVKATADVKGSGGSAKVGVGVSAGVHVGVNTTVADVADKALLRGGTNLALNASANHAVDNTVEGGAAGAKVSITPVVAVSVAVNTTQAHIGSQAAGPNTGLNLLGTLSSDAEQTHTMKTSAKGAAAGEIAVGAALVASVAVDDVSSTLGRDLESSTGLSLASSSDTSITTIALASAKGAKAATKNATTGEEETDAGASVDEQKKTQLDFAKGRNSGASGVDTTDINNRTKSETPATSNATPGTDKPSGAPSKEQSGKKVSVAAAIGAGVAFNESRAEIGSGLNINTGSGELKVKADSGTNYNTKSSGEAVSDNVGVGVAVSLTATSNRTEATIGSGTNVSRAGDVTVSAESLQNRGAGFTATQSAEAVAGASGGDVAVAGALAVVVNNNITRASINEGVTLGSVANPVGDVTVKADDTSKIAAQARAGAISTGSGSKAGVGASFAALVSNNVNEAVVGRDANASGTSDATELHAQSLAVEATKGRVQFVKPENFSLNDIKNLNFDALDPANYLGSNNYYTEAVAGAAAKGNAAVAGSFAVNVFNNNNSASIGENVKATTVGVDGVDVSSLSDTQAIAFTGAVAGAKQAGVGISNTNLVSLDKTTASIGSGSDVRADGVGADVNVSAEARQDLANIGVSAGAATSGTGVGGVLGVMFSLGTTEAEVADNAAVKAKGDVSVTAKTDITGVIVAGGVGAANTTGVGASVAANILAQTTQARIGSDANVSGAGQTTVSATAKESSVSTVLAGAGAGTTAVAGALSVNVLVSDTQATIGQDAKVNTDAAYTGAQQGVGVLAKDDSTVVAITGGGAGGGTTGVGAALDTTVSAKTVKAAIDDDSDADADKATVNAKKDVVLDASASENLVSVTVGFAGGGTTGVGGAVSLGVMKNDVQARIGEKATVDADGNVGVNAQDDITAVMTAGAAAGGGTTGVGGSLAVATLLGSSKATIGDGATVNARGLGDARSVYTGETVFSDTATQPTTLGAKRTEDARGLSVTAYNREKLVTTVASGAGGGTTGVAATVSANVIANTTEASIGRSALINQNNAGAGAQQQVRVKAIDETLLINTAGGAAGGGTAGVGAAANVGVIVKNTTASIGRDSVVNAVQAVEVEAASSDLSVSTTVGLAGGGSVGVGGSVGGVAVANTTRAFIEDGTSAADAAAVTVSGGDLTVAAEEFASSWLISGGGGGGGAAGVGAALSVGVNSSTTEARIGNFTQTDATGTTSVTADSTENVNTVTVAGAGGGTAGVAGSIAMNVVVSKTEAAIGQNARVNQTLGGAAQDVNVSASDRIVSVAIAGAGAGGGAAGVGVALDATIAQNRTIAAIEQGAQVDADRNVGVEATGDKYVNAATVAGSGGGAAGVSGAVSIIAVGLLLDSDAKEGLGGRQAGVDGETTKSAVGNMLGSSAQSVETRNELDSRANKMAVSSYLADTAVIPTQNTQASIAALAQVDAGQDVTVQSEDKTTAIMVAGVGAGGGAAGVGGSVGVVLLRDSASATVGNGAAVDAGGTIKVDAETAESVYNVGISGAGGGAAAVMGSIAVNVVSSETVANIGDANINQTSATGNRSVLVGSRSDTSLITVAGAGGGAGAAAVGGVVNVNVLTKDTRASIGEGATVEADRDVAVKADSEQKIIGASISIQGAGAAAVGVSVATNVIDNNTEAFIGSHRDDATKTAASVDSSGNVVISAADDTLIVGVAASGTGAGAAAVGGTVSVNVVSSETRAYLGDQSEVIARGVGADAMVYDGTINNAAAQALPSRPAGQTGSLDVDNDGTAEGSVGGAGGASFSVNAKGSGGSGNANGTANPSTTKNSEGNAIANAGGGLGTRGTSAVSGFAVTAVGSEKVVTTSLGVAGAGAAGVTLGATANVISSVTDARIGDSARVNQGGGAVGDVKVTATDDTFMVMAAGTVAGAAAAAVSGSSNTAVVNKQTSARVGDADVKGANLAVAAASTEEMYIATANVAGAIAGVGAAVGVGTVKNTTTAGIEAGANVDATGDLRVTAGQDTAMDLYTVAGAGGVVGVSGAVSVGVVDNTTQAFVGGAASAADAAVLNAGGTTEVAATSKEELTSVTISAAVGGVGVAGSVGVKVLESETTASIGDNVKVNQIRNGAAQDVKVSATDTVALKGGGGAGVVGGFGAGAISDTNIVRNTTTASIGSNAVVDADRDIAVNASSSKSVDSTAVAIAATAGGGVAGAVSVAVIGANLDADSQKGLGDGNTASKADSQMQRNEAGGELDTTDSEHLAGAKTTLATQSSGLGVASDMNDSTAGSKDKTLASVGTGARVTAGRDIDVTATDRTQLNLLAAGASGGFVGIGGAVAVGLTNSTTEAKVGGTAVLEANSDNIGTGSISVAASAGNVDATGSRVRATAGAGGVIGVSAAVSVLKDTSVTRAVIGDSARIERGDELLVNAETTRKSAATTLGAAAGGLAIGASVASATFGGTTSAFFESNVDVGKTAGKLVQDVIISATDGSVATASATAGAAGILSGSGAVALAEVTSGVSATMGSGAEVVAQDDVSVTAEATPETRASALGVTVGAGSVGASVATARTNANVSASVGSGANISGDQFDVVARREVGSNPTTAAQAFGASGGVLFGANATLAKASSEGSTRATVDDNATLTLRGAATVHADSNTLQSSSGVGISVGGLLAVGAVKSEATSNTTTEASIGNGVKLSGPTPATGSSLSVLADSADTNFAHGIAGSGGLVSAPFSEAKTVSNSTTTASTGSGNNDAVNPRKIDVTGLNVAASHTGQFDAWMDSTNASLIGVSGAKATNTSNSTTTATVGNNGFVEADSFTVQAANTVKKGGPAAANLPGVTSVTGTAVPVPAWNVNSASGGLADVPAADSLTNISNNAIAQVGGGATVQQTGSMLAPGAFRVDASNQVDAKDRVKMASGGAVSAASGSSKVQADTNLAKVEVGDDAKLSATGDLMLGARSVANVSTQTAVDVWGLVGVAPKGDSVSLFKADNRIEVGSATLQAQNDIRLNAGASTQYNPEIGSNTGLNQGVVTARTDVFNNTAIPVNRDPVADATIETHSQITIDPGAKLNAVSDVALFAEKGEATASGVGVGKDLYREALAAVGSAISNAFGGDDVSFETRTGNSVKTQTSNVTVNGEVHVGINRKQNLEIDKNGNATVKTDGIGIAGTGVRSLAQDIIDRIDALNDLIRQYSGGSAGTDAAIAVAAYQSEIRFLERKLLELGFKPDPADPSGGVSFTGVASISPLAAAQQAVNAMTGTRTTYVTDRNAREGQNSTLSGQNTTLNGQINNLRDQNAILQDDIDDLTAQRNALADTPANAAQRQSLLNQINSKTTEIGNNNTSIGNKQNTIDANDDTIAVNTTEINRLNPLITSLTGQITNVQTDITNGVYSNAVAAGPSATFLTISDAEAKLGNIYVRGDRLQGSGVLDAPGDAEIKITNNGPSFLVLNNLSIPADEGGRIYLNSVDVKNNAQINGINGAAGGANFNVFTTDSTTDFSGSSVLPGKPKILVESKYDPLDSFYSGQYPAGQALPAPDIIVKGDISNLRGLVKIESAAGSIRLEENANIRADSVEVKTRNGDFVQSYTNTFSHVAGAPLSTIPGDNNLAFPGNIARIQRGAQDGKGITANGSVLLAARYLNINGTVQSGIPEWGIRIPADAAVSIGGVSSTFAQAQAHYNSLTPAQKAVLGSEFYQVSGATVTGLSGNQQGAWENIKVTYNAKEDRLELGGVRVQGGYIEIFGQIFNTNQNNGGKLRVLDGYGQIKVDNDSSKAMWVNLLDTGKGVKGEINITNITGISANGTPQISTTQFLRNPGAARTGAFYDPQAGLRFTTTVGYDQGRVDYYRYSQNGWFGALFLSPEQLDQYRIDSQVRSNDPLSQAEYLKVVSGDNSAVYSPTTSAVYNTGGGGSITGGDQQTIATAAPITTNGRSWRDCNWWTLCANATHYREFTITTATKTTITESIKADQRIGVEFIGFDQGTVDVDSVGSVVLNGGINNASGQTTVRSGGSITQNGDVNMVTGRNITLAAGTGIGTGTQAVQTNVSDTGRLDATSNSGQVHIKEMVGDMNVGTIGGAGVSNVVLEADKNIVNANAGSSVQGRRVELLSNNGAIGSTGTPLTVRTGHTTNMSDWPNNGLKATARDSINVRNLNDGTNPAVYNGNLLLISAESKTGDVRIETSGAVIDNNPFETVDTRTQTELANLWDELRLRGAPSVQKADEAVAAFERGKDNNYRLYWQLRKGQADGGLAYDPAYAYVASAGERAALVEAGLTPAQITAFEQSRTSQYRALHAEVGGLTASFDGGYAYNASTAEEASIRSGATWTDAQLALSVGAGLLKNITDTVTSVKAPNVKGNNIQLVAGTSIGSLNPNVVINLPSSGATPAEITTFLNSLTIEQKAALAAAERGDATVTGNQISIIRPRPVNVETGTGALTASAAAGAAYIGSEQDLRVNQVTASDDVRIKVAGALINAATVAGLNNVAGDNIILEAASGGIGAPGSAMRVSPTASSSLIARAAGDIWVEAPVNLTVDTIFSRNNVNLDVTGSILDMPGDSLTTPAVNIRSNNVTLRSRTGSIGRDDNPLDLGVNPDGRIDARSDAVGQGIFLNGPSGERFNVGASTSGGATVLSAAEEVKVDGTVTGLGTISLVSGGKTTLTTRADVVSGASDIQIRAGSLAMEDDGTDAARVRSSTGTIDIQTAGDAQITGVESGNGTADAVRVVSTGGRVLDAGDTRLDVIADSAPAAKLTASGLLGVGSNGNPLDVRVRDLNVSSANGSVAVSAVGDVNVDAVVAGDAVALTASGNITGDSVSSTGSGTQGPDKSVQVTSSGGSVVLASVSGQQGVRVDGVDGVDLGTVSSTNGSVALVSGAGDVKSGTAQAGQDVTMTALAGSISADKTTATGGNVDLSALNGVVAATTVAGGKVSVNSSSGSARLTDVTAGGDVGVKGNTGVDVGTAKSTAGSVAFSSSSGDVKSGTATAGLDVKMASPAGSISSGVIQAGRDVELLALGQVDVDSATAGRDLTVNSATAGVRAGTLRSGASLTIGAAQSIDIRNATAGGNLSLTSSRGRIDLGAGGAGGTANLFGGQGVSVDQLDAANIALASPGGDLNVGALQAAGGEIALNAGGDIGVGSAASRTFSASSSNASISVGSVSADEVTMTAPGEISANALDVGRMVNLAGSRLAASIRATGSADVGGSFTGFGGGMASDVQLRLNTPYAFRFSNLFTSTGNLEIPSGDLYIGSLWVGDRMTLSNPWTRVLVDQNNLAIQPFDVQLYSAGAPFPFSLVRNRVSADAFVIYRSPAHEVLTPNGNNISAAELADRELALLGFMAPLFPSLGGNGGRGLSNLVSFSELPVQTDEECKPGQSQGSQTRNASKCKENSQ